MSYRSLAVGCVLSFALAACGGGSDEPPARTVNLAPVFVTTTAPASVVAACGRHVTGTFAAVDPEGGVVSYAATGLPAGATVTPQGAGAAFDWTPDPSQVGSYDVAIRATDGADPALSATTVFHVDVTAATTVTVRFDDRGTSTVASLTAGDLTVTGSANLYLLNLNGLGVVGGIDNCIDGSEWVDYAFAVPVGNVSYFVQVAGQLNGTGGLGEAFIEAFAPGGASLGVLSTSGGGSQPVSSRYGGALLQRVRVSANVDNHRTSSISFVSCAN